MSMLDAFTPRAQRVVALAQEEARFLKHNYLGTEHILLGLIREEEGLAGHALTGLHITLDHARTQVVAIEGRGTEKSPREIPCARRATQVFERALRIALSRCTVSPTPDQVVDTEDILLGLVEAEEGVAARVLLNLDVDSEQIKAALA